ncbi:hypothetical protein BH09MYX1_BH09MYX1_58910 [soil metagenome]
MLNRVVRGALPLVAFATFVITMKTCFRVARAAGHLDVYDAMGWTPVISFFGGEDPERFWFHVGFTLLAVLVALTLFLRGRQLRVDRHLEKAWARRGVASVTAVIAIACLLVMTWVSDGESPIHFIAAVSTFFFLSIRELVETSLVITSTRARGFRAWHAVMILWCVACPLASMFHVYAWIANEDVRAQYIAVGLQFAFFLGSIPELARAAPRIDPTTRDATAPA